MKVSTLLTFLVLSMYASGCDVFRDDIAYSRFEKVEGRMWADTAEYFFSFPVRDTDQKYEVTGVVRYVPDFGFKNLPIGIVSEGADISNPRFETEVRNLSIGQDRAGTGSEHFVVREVRFVIEEGKTYDTPGIYTYSFRQLADTARIGGVGEVGLVVRKL